MLVVLPPLLPSSQVIRALQLASLTLSLMEPAENPAKITEWAAPNLAIANIAMIAWAFIGK